MSTRTKYIVWIDARDGDGWGEQGDGALTLKQAQRITREIQEDFPRCRVKFLPVGDRPINKIPWTTWMLSRQQ